MSGKGTTRKQSLRSKLQNTANKTNALKSLTSGEDVTADSTTTTNSSSFRGSSVGSKISSDSSLTAIPTQFTSSSGNIAKAITDIQNHYAHQGLASYNLYMRDDSRNKETNQTTGTPKSDFAGQVIVFEEDGSSVNANGNSVSGTVRLFAAPNEKFTSGPYGLNVVVATSHKQITDNRTGTSGTMKDQQGKFKLEIVRKIAEYIPEIIPSKSHLECITELLRLNIQNITDNDKKLLTDEITRRLNILQMNKASLTVDDKTALWGMLPELQQELYLSFNQIKACLFICTETLKTQNDVSLLIQLLKSYSSEQQTELCDALKDTLDPVFLIMVWDGLHKDQPALLDDNNSVISEITIGSSSTSLSGVMPSRDHRANTMTSNTSTAALAQIFRDTSWLQDNFIWTLVNKLPKNNWDILTKSLNEHNRANLVSHLFNDPALLQGRQDFFTAKEIEQGIRLCLLNNTDVKKQKSQYTFLNTWLQSAENSTKAPANGPTNILNNQGYNDYVDLRGLRNLLNNGQFTNSNSDADPVLYKSQNECLTVRNIDSQLFNTTDETAWENLLLENAGELIPAASIGSKATTDGVLHFQNTLYLALNRGGNSTQWTLDILFNNNLALLDSLLALSDDKKTQTYANSILNMVFLADPIKFLACFANRVPENNKDFNLAAFKTWQKLMEWAHEHNVFSNSSTWLSPSNSAFISEGKIGKEDPKRNSIDEAVRKQVIKSATSLEATHETKQPNWLGQHIEIPVVQSKTDNISSSNSRSSTPGLSEPKPSEAKVSLKTMPGKDKDALNDLVAVARKFKKEKKITTVQSLDSNSDINANKWTTGARIAFWLAVVFTGGIVGLVGLGYLIYSACTSKPASGEDGRGEYSAVEKAKPNAIIKQQDGIHGVDSAEIKALLTNTHDEDQHSHSSTRSHSEDSKNIASKKSVTSGKTLTQTPGHLIADVWQAQNAVHSTAKAPVANNSNSFTPK